ncbi:MAG TPA: trimethylamine methyltransferase family protein [Terriglobia bacterium]|nr:trimethylamine methyltransferase family protein [Terriglobia bacterium]
MQKEFKPRISLVSSEALHRIHDAALRLLAETGMKIECSQFYGPLEAQGARVDRASGVVRFPEALVECTIERLRRQIAGGQKQCLLNGVISSRTDGGIAAKFGGACIEYLDWEKQEVRQPDESDLVRLVQLGHALADVATVGNPVILLRDSGGRPIEPRLQRIRTAALIAKHTDKCGPTEVCNEQELTFQIELGTVVRGSLDAYLRRPCFVTAKETIAPLIFPEADGRVLLALAQRGLPCTVVPMPMCGATCPVHPASNVLMTVAETLGVMTAISSVVPTAMVASGVISCVLDMRSGAATFCSPEVLWQDLVAAQLFEQEYGQDFGLGTGYTDAGFPGAQALAEKSFRFWVSALSGRTNYPVGIMSHGKRFSPEQAILDLEIARYIDRYMGGYQVSDETLSLDLIQQVGIGGSFIAEEHTARNFRQCLWQPALFDRGMSQGLSQEQEGDAVAAARDEWRSLLAKTEPYHIPPEKEREIVRIVAAAERLL